MNRFALISLLMLSFFNSHSYASEQIKEYKFGVFPYLPTNRIKKVYTPVARNFEKTLATPVSLGTKPTYAEFKKSLLNEEFDIAFVQPYDYILAHDEHHYLPLARRKAPLRTVIIVNKNSTYKELNHLKGKIIVTPAPHSAVSRITDKILKKHGFNTDTDVIRKYKKNHFSCMQSVIINEAAACGTAERALKHFSDKNMEAKFRVLHNAIEIPNSLFIVHKRVPEKARKKLIESIINWPNSVAGKKILAGGKITPMIRTQNNVYDLIR